MSWKLRLLIPAILAAPQAALGLGLGEIRLSSALNEPLAAEIDLVAATSEELTTLRAQLASRELFQRYGLDRPGWLDSLDFKVGRGRDGQNVLLVRSRGPIGEPFVTFLVDVNWPSGHLLREYTVLLDPPVFVPAAPAVAPAPVAAPRVESRVERQPTPPPAATEPASPAAEAGQVSTYRVLNGDTLYGIAGQLQGGGRAATRQMAIALFRANPEAFGGNINLLRAGSILRVPAAAEVAEISAADAAAEISRQTAAWREASAVADSGQLRLVTPADEAGTAAPAPPAEQPASSAEIGDLQRRLAEQRRLLEVKDRELAELQQQLAEARAARQAVAAGVPPTVLPAEQPPAEAEVAPQDDAGTTAGTPAEPASAEPAPVKPKARPAAPSTIEEPSLLARLTEHWLVILGAAVLLLGGLLGYGYIRRRREEDLDEALKGFDVPASAPVPSETMRLRALAAGAGATGAAPEAGEDVVVAERPAARRAPEAPSRPAVHDETISAEAALDLDQADPLAEADFHMAYGLYDQAADLVRMALRNEPERSDLKMKLAEIHFVAGDAAQFLTVARDLHRSIDASSDWDRIVIMGRQIAPDDPLFAGEMSVSAGVDLSLEGGESRVDLELLSAPEGDGGLDIDFGGEFAPDETSAAPTGEAETLGFDQSEVTLPPGATTREMPRVAAAGTVEMPTIEMPMSDTPTVETTRPAVDATAEMAIDDLGLDLSGLPDLGVDDATRIAPSAEATRLMPAADADRTALLPEIDSGATSQLPQIDGEAGLDLDVGAMAAPHADATATERMELADLPGLGELDPVTMSEVGTKLDLARAYMDMGDPDGARSILQEVLAEGSASQKAEARRLVDSLPGA
ncbi:MAG: hypothetical protein FJ191_08635 [Gammaproteobacteria bacterium]|nr:hypothetical protein [Gammaproteobacteria bacterium]